MACQLRFSTSTVAFVNMFITMQTTTAHGRLGVCSLLKSARKNWLPLLVMLQLSLFQSRCADFHTQQQMVAREGAAPPISGCKPDVILFHHRAEKELAASLGFAPGPSGSK